MICASLAFLLASPSNPMSSELDFSLPQFRGGTFHLRVRPQRPVLLAFLQTVPDVADTPSRSEAVFLTSMAQQYGPRGLRVVAIDVSALANHRSPDPAALINASYDWHLNFALLEDANNRVAERYKVEQLPTIVLFAADGKIAQRWQGLTRPAQLAQGIERLLGGPLGRLPEL